MLSKVPSSTIFWVFGMTRPGIEPWSPGPLANTLPTRAGIKVDDQKAPFTIASTVWCEGGASSFLGLLHFTLDIYLIMLRVKQVPSFVYLVESLYEFIIYIISSYNCYCKKHQLYHQQSLLDTKILKSDVMHDFEATVSLSKTNKFYRF